MGPVEIVFLIVILIFGVIGAVRGFSREIGVTVMLLIALLILQMIDHLAPTWRDRVLGFIAGDDPAALLVARAIVYSLFLILIAFVSYQGATLTFPNASNSGVMGFLAGILNGYLFAGSIWYYEQLAGWPFVHVTAIYDSLYLALIRLLPPAILDWRFLIAMVVLMMIFRVWR
jgi:hypothetical protein